MEALETFSDLGSGFNLAMQDLDIRGAGNLLGAEQSGFMEDLGYETYQKILSQAVTELKNDEFSDLYEDDIKQGREVSGADFVDDCSIESDLEMFFPDSYVPGSAERMLLYRELDNIEREEDLQAYRQRLIDRFGPSTTAGRGVDACSAASPPRQATGLREDHPQAGGDEHAVCVQPGLGVL